MNKRNDIFWVQCGNCHLWAKVMVPVNGINGVAVLCQNDGCDCLLNVTVKRDPKNPHLDSDIIINIMTEF